jgi:23S rRNA (pseudouridine1915-N3)-methyltransferase
MASRKLAEWLQDHALHGSPGVALIIGGAYGIHPDVGRRARRRVSLSAMTLPHEMARLVLVEQIYRAGTILRGEPYHKGP